MEALGNSGDGRIFLNTFQGKFTKRTNSEDKEAIQRTNKMGKEVWERHFDTLNDVIIQKVEKRDSEEYGFSWNIYLAHAKSDETFVLTLPYSGRITMGLFLRFPNFRVADPITIRIGWFEDEKAAIWLLQKAEKGGSLEKVEMFWTKDNPGDLPDLEPTTRDGKEAWDSTKRMAALEYYINKEVTPKLNSMEVAAKEPAAPILDTSSVKTAGGIATKVEGAKVIYDEVLQKLKMIHSDSLYYECDEAGTFKRDAQGKMIAIETDDLPF